jgi:hypothetical protein
VFEQPTRINLSKARQAIAFSHGLDPFRTLGAPVQWRGERHKVGWRYDPDERKAEA